MTVPFPPEFKSIPRGWKLTWFRLRPTCSGIGKLEDLRDRITQEIAEQYEGVVTSELPTVAAVRKLFRNAGTDPTRYRPSSEALLRRVLKGDSIPAIHPMVDLNNLLSLRLMVPCCVIDAGVVEPPFNFRIGEPGESMESMRGTFNLESKPLLEDAEGPFGTPITDSERVKIRSDTSEVWMVAYLPSESSSEEATKTLEELLEFAPVAELLDYYST